MGLVTPKLLLHKHSPYQSGLVAQKSMTLISLAEGSRGRACRYTYMSTCIHACVLYNQKMNETQTSSHLKGLLSAHAALCSASLHHSSVSACQHAKSNVVSLKTRSPLLKSLLTTFGLLYFLLAWLIAPCSETLAAGSVSGLVWWLKDGSRGEGQQPQGVEQEAGGRGEGSKLLN